MQMLYNSTKDLSLGLVNRVNKKLLTRTVQVNNSILTILQDLYYMFILSLLQPQTDVLLLDHNTGKTGYPIGCGHGVLPLHPLLSLNV